MNLNIRLKKYRPKLGREVIDSAQYDDDELAPVMPAIDAVQQLIESECKAENRNKIQSNDRLRDEMYTSNRPPSPKAGTSKQFTDNMIDQSDGSAISRAISKPEKKMDNYHGANVTGETYEADESSIIINNPLEEFKLPSIGNNQQNSEEYEFIPKSVTLDVYSNDPEVKRFLKQLPKISHESGLNEQDYKCYSCRRPIGLVFGQPRLCRFDGHHYCSECHLNEKSIIPARILCNWDFNLYPVSKRNQHFLTLISNESMFELKKIAPLMYKMCPELREIEELRRQAFFVRSYCTTCVQDSISFELTKLIWPREHLIKQTDTYSLEDLKQLKSGALKQVLKNVITFGRQHVLSCVLCRQKGFICELCKSSQIIYPFDTESVHRCNECQSIYHKLCFKSNPSDNACPRCQRLEARRSDNNSIRNPVMT